MNHTIATYSFELSSFERTGVPGEAERAFTGALGAANLFANQKRTVENDQHLSTAGKQAKLAPMSSQLWKTIFVSAKAVQGERLKIETRTAHLYDIGSPVTPYEIAIDRERRDYWRSLGSPERIALLGVIEATPVFAPFVKSILRTPVPDLLDVEIRLLRDTFEKIRREEDSDLYALIKDDQGAVDWAERGLAHIIGISQSKGMTGITSQGVLTMAIESGDGAAALALGYSPNEIAVEKRKQEAKRRMAA